MAALGDGPVPAGLGASALRTLLATVDADNEPNTEGQHRGSAYRDGWYGYVRKDLQTVLGRKVRGRYSREFCGRGSLRRCQRALRRPLRAALAVPATEVYGGDPKCPDADQWCFDAIEFKATGGATQPLIHWVNGRPTSRRPRSGAGWDGRFAGLTSQAPSDWRRYVARDAV